MQYNSYDHGNVYIRKISLPPPHTHTHTQLIFYIGPNGIAVGDILMEELNAGLSWPRAGPVTS